MKERPILFSPSVEIRCRSSVNIADDATMVVVPLTFTGGSTISNKVILSRPIKKGEVFTFALTEREKELNRSGKWHGQ